MDANFLKVATKGLSELGEALALLTGAEISVQVPARPVIGSEALRPLALTAYWMETTLLADASVRVGLAMPEPFARKLGAQMLMLPEVPPAMTDEVAAAFDEAMNVAIGAWNTAMQNEHNRWDNSVDARRIITLGDVDFDAQEHGLGALLASARLDGEEIPLVLLGDLGWFPASARVEGLPLPEDDAEEQADASDEAIDAPAAPATPAAVERPPSMAAAAHAVSVAGGSSGRAALGAHEASPPDPSETGEVASIIIVDRCGALADWLMAQLSNPELRFYKSTDPLVGDAGARAVVLVDPKDLETARLRAARTIIMRRASGEGGP